MAWPGLRRSTFDKTTAMSAARRSANRNVIHELLFFSLLDDVRGWDPPEDKTGVPKHRFWGYSLAACLSTR